MKMLWTDLATIALVKAAAKLKYVSTAGKIRHAMVPLPPKEGKNVLEQNPIAATANHNAKEKEGDRKSENLM